MQADTYVPIHTIVDFVEQYVDFVEQYVDKTDWMETEATHEGSDQLRITFRFRDTLPRQFVVISADRFKTLDRVKLYEIVSSPMMGKTLEGPWYTRIWRFLLK